MTPAEIRFTTSDLVQTFEQFIKRYLISATDRRVGTLSLLLVFLLIASLPLPCEAQSVAALRNSGNTKIALKRLTPMGRASRSLKWRHRVVEREEF